VASFYLPVKSTIDKIAIDIATTLSVGAVEIDDTTNVEAALASPDDLLMFQLVDMDGNDPLYRIRFELGVKTTADSANYDLATLLSSVQDELEEGDTFYIRDFSTLVAPTDDLGFLYITDVSIDPQAFDGASGVRMQTILGKVVRYV
jgi:hypothetical protein